MCIRWYQQVLSCRLLITEMRQAHMNSMFVEVPHTGLCTCVLVIFSSDVMKLDGMTDQYEPWSSVFLPISLVQAFCLQLLENNNSWRLDKQIKSDPSASFCEVLALCLITHNHGSSKMSWWETQKWCLSCLMKRPWKELHQSETAQSAGGYVPGLTLENAWQRT